MSVSPSYINHLYCSAFLFVAQDENCDDAYSSNDENALIVRDDAPLICTTGMFESAPYCNDVVVLAVCPRKFVSDNVT